MPNLQSITILTIILRLGLAVVVGGIIGMNRGRKKMPAGFRTHILVCMGAALTMITNQYVADTYGGDRMRAGAQVISGIGFLGAGTIIVTGHNKVKGLTTAASLWASGCLGLAIGIGFYSGAIIASLYMLFVMTGLQRFDEWIIHQSKNMGLYIEFSTIEDMTALLQNIQNEGVLIADIDMSHIHDNHGAEISVLLNLRLSKHASHTELIRQMSQYPGVRYIQEM